MAKLEENIGLVTDFLFNKYKEVDLSKNPSPEKYPPSEISKITGVYAGQMGQPYFYPAVIERLRARDVECNYVKNGNSCNYIITYK